MIKLVGKNPEYRLPLPETKINSSIIDIMYSCLQRDPKKRPMFSDLIKRLERVKYMREIQLIKQLYCFYGPINSSPSLN